MEKKAKTPTPGFPENMMKPEHNDDYYMKLGLVGNEDEISRFLDVDEQTKLPYGFGYDEFIKELKESSSTESKQDLIRDVLRKVGIQSVSHLLEKANELNLNKEFSKVLKTVYKIDKFETAKPYDKISQDKNPRSRQVELDSPNIYPQDVSDQEFGNELVTSQRKANKLIRLLERVDPTRAKFDGLDDENMDEDNLLEYKYYESSVKDKLLGYKRKHRDILRQRVAEYHLRKSKEISQLKYNKFLDFEKEKEDKLLQERKFENGDTVPEFKQFISSAEEYISLAGGSVRRRAVQDEIEKNWHFKPRYLNREFTSDDFAWNSFIREVPTVRAKVMSGSLDPTMDPEDLKDYTNVLDKVTSEPFVPEKNMKLPATIYRIIRSDSYHRHFLENHLRIFADDLNVGLLTTKGNLSGIAGNKIIPWEYVSVIKQQIMFKRDDQASTVDKLGRAYGAGRRKTSGAQCWIWPGIGRITVNGKSLIEYFRDLNFRERVILPFRVTCTTCEFDAKINVRGGGIAGQSDAAKRAVAEAIRRYEPSFSTTMRKFDLLQNDPRQVERKKTSKYKARKAYTFVKR
jgi:small subunit ribosomal protein S9